MEADLIASSPPLPQHELEQLQNAVNFGPDVASPVISGYGPPSVTSDSVSIASLPYSTAPLYMTSIQPKPCYASRESASRAATELYRQHKELDSDPDNDLDDDTERVQVSETATAHVNSFLDKVLHDILVLAQSTQLPQLRTAAAEVLRRNLGKEAVAYADANLEDLLAAESEDEDGEDNVSTPTDSATKWDLESSWKRIRLRVMMRSENSDFDIDDDEHHASQAGLSGLTRRLGDSSAAVISLHSEIFLAGVLDFISDHVFAVAIIPALIRMRRGSKKSPAQIAEPNVLFVEEADLEKGVLNSPLDRLWRGWRKSTRSRASYPTSPRHGYSYSDASSPDTQRRGSTQWGDGPYHTHGQDLMTPRGMPGEYIETPAVEYSERVMASNIPLPTNANDVEEIETPGLAEDPDDYLSAKQHTDRPTSAIHVPQTNPRNSLGIAITEEESLKAGQGSDINPNNTFALDTAKSDSAGDKTPTVRSTGQVAINPETASALTGGQPLTPELPKDGGAADVRHPERSSSLSNPVASPSPASKRNREAAIGMGFPNGISIPGDAIPRSPDLEKLPQARPESVQTTSSKRESRDDPRLRAASPSSETEGSEIMSPRDFMAARNLHSTRLRSETSPLPSPSVPSPTKSGVLAPLRTKLQTSGISPTRGEHSPVSPLTASEIGLERPSDSSKYGVVTNVSSGPPSAITSAPTSGIPASVPASAPSSRKTSAPAGRLTDDLARARGSPKVRQTSLQDRESLRRIAVERNGSLVSLVDENSHRPRKQTPLTSSSIVTAEDFDSLLNGSDTIKMTLSPSSVREAPSLPGSRSGSIDQTALAKFNGSQNDLASALKKKMAAENPRSPSLNSPSIGSSDKSGRGRSGSAATEKTGRSSSRPSVRNKSRTRAGFMAREPTVQTDSTRDFADFIRSTGPDREPQTLVPALTTQRQPSIGGRSQRQPSISAQRQPSVTGVTSPQRSGSLAGPQISETAGIKYKRNYAPREARGSEPDGNAGLIDFIRSGPTPAKSNVPSKDIAPFRYSMDSDEMREAVINLDEPDGHRASISTMNTMHTMMTYGSHAPLVNGRQQSVSTSPMGGSTPRLAPETQKPKKSSNYVTNADGVQRYRNKDPYAIDISDDEDEEFLSPPRGKSGSAQHTSRSGSTSLGPFMSDTDASSDPRSLPSSRTPTAPPTSGLALNGVSFQPASTPVSQPAPQSPTARSGSMASLSAPTPKSAAAAVPGRVVIPRNPNRPKPELRAAGGRAESSSTRDLADFFKNSAPPPSSAPSPNIGSSSVSEKKEKEGGKGKFWSRRRYLDMP
ncbi:hypothetical protein K461DRAFT_295471 [Myriangium duriaei CBS 260.36]|uniref:Uncharacterized protein n=1 Tax=Myriangium duriaei CBS 260.36 TaxID=1168546 RepID=A0A9P4IZM2_9PEZI|nr:hypothetical protein K461DRAFT_295471 [Myriangium duriaei CBS 260.36]